MEMVDIMVERIREAVKSAVASLILKDLAAALLLRSFPIYVDREAPTAYTDGWGIYLPPNFHELKPAEQMFILLHELGHIVALHLPRGKALLEKRGIPLSPSSQYVLNVAADYVVDTQLFPQFLPGERASMWRNFKARFPQLPDNASFEEVAETLLDLLSPLPQQLGEGGGMTQQPGQEGGGQEEKEEGGADSSSASPQPGQKEEGGADSSSASPSLPPITPDLRPTPSNAVEVQKGEGERPQSSEEEAEEVRRRLARAIAVAKAAGRSSPGGLQRLVDELLKPKVNWHSLLRVAMERGLGRSVRRTWSRPSRKAPSLPGKEFVALKKVVTLVDTSGSIDVEELRQFVAEIYGIAAATSQVVVIPWDAQPYERIVLKRKSDVRKLVLTGGGDTLLLPALQAAEKERPHLIVILSDWDLGDYDDARLHSLLEKWRRRIIAVTTERNPPVPLLTIKLKR
ncbi:MAG: VWA-like domain-containing protein [Thermofilum sp.]